jgi:hypothetical protein
MKSYRVDMLTITKMPYSYSAKNMLNSEAHFARTYNTAGVDTDTPIALRWKSNMSLECFKEQPLKTSGAYWPLSLPENASFKRTLLASLTASPLRGVA